jgi:hypothetical protein
MGPFWGFQTIAAMTAELTISTTTAM